jgi:hypothetical protein
VSEVAVDQRPMRKLESIKEIQPGEARLADVAPYPEK